MKKRTSKLETPSARLRLPPRGKPYYTLAAPNVSLGYRRTQPGTAGSWTVRCTLDGADWTKRLAIADDLEPAAPPHVLSYWQALDAARALARRQPGEATDETKPLTLAEALDRYELDLSSRGGDCYNAQRARIHLPASLLTKPVAMLSASELKRWRDALAAKLSPASVNRTRTCVRAACEWALGHDPRVASNRAWKVGLAGLPDAHRARNEILPDHDVRRLVVAAHAHEPALGVLIETLATTGARFSQVARLEVGDLQADRLRVMLPRSAKGRVRTKRHERRAVPIPASLAALLQEAAGNRPMDAPLLLRANGGPWEGGRGHQYRRDFQAVVTACGLDPEAITPYALRHSSIVRQLLANVPIRVIAASHDTSVGQIERNYSHLISEHSDAVSRGALLDVRAESSDNIVPLRVRS